MTTTLALVLGAATGLGLVLMLVACLRPAPLDVAAAWQRISLREQNGPAVATGWRAHRDRLATRAVTHAARAQHPWLTLPETDLAVLDRTPARYLTRRVTGTLIGTTTVVLGGGVLALLGLAVPPSLLAVLALGAAAAGAMLPVFAVREAAATARDECRRSLAVYLDLVAQERTAGHAPTQALREAAQVGQNWVFLRLRTALADAARTGETPWQALRQLGQRYAVVELCDVADIAATAADGAAIQASLRTKAAALRTATVTRDKAEANARSERLSLPTSLLLIGFLLLVLYPTAIRLVTG